MQLPYFKETEPNFDKDMCVEIYLNLRRSVDESNGEIVLPFYLNTYDVRNTLKELNDKKRIENILQIRFEMYYSIRYKCQKFLAKNDFDYWHSNLHGYDYKIAKIEKINHLYRSAKLNDYEKQILKCLNISKEVVNFCISYPYIENIAKSEWEYIRPPMSKENYTEKDIEIFLNATNIDITLNRIIETIEKYDTIKADFFNVNEDGVDSFVDIKSIRNSKIDYSMFVPKKEKLDYEKVECYEEFLEEN